MAGCGPAPVPDVWAKKEVGSCFAQDRRRSSGLKAAEENPGSIPGDGLLRRETEDSVHITLPTRIEFSEIDHGF